MASFIQSELEGMLLLSAAELQKFPFESRTSGSTGYAYHLFRGSLIPRMIATHGGMLLRGEWLSERCERQLRAQLQRRLPLKRRLLGLLRVRRCF